LFIENEYCQKVDLLLRFSSIFWMDFTTAYFTFFSQQVHYVLEGNRFAHTPGALPFQDKWLWAIISDKIRVRRSVDF